MIHALVPVALLIALGYLLRASGFLPEPAWAPIDRLVYHVLFPCLLLNELAMAELEGLPVLAVTAALLLTQLAMGLLAAAAKPAARLSGPAYTSVLQCVVRWNSYVALALAPLLFGSASLPLVALAVAVMVPTANLLSVAALARHGRGARAGLGAFGRAIATNPLILACALGVAINVSGIAWPPLLHEPVAILARATLALGLLTVGAGLRPAVVADRPGVILATTAAQLLVKPMLAAALGLLLGLGNMALGVVVLACAVPTATSSYILARLLGGDAELMAALVTTTTLAALATLPLVLAVVGALG